MALGCLTGTQPGSDADDIDVQNLVGQYVRVQTGCHSGDVGYVCKGGSGFVCTQLGVTIPADSTPWMLHDTGRFLPPPPAGFSGRMAMLRAHDLAAIVLRKPRRMRNAENTVRRRYATRGERRGRPGDDPEVQRHRRNSRRWSPIERNQFRGAANILMGLWLDSRSSTSSSSSSSSSFSKGKRARDDDEDLRAVSSPSSSSSYDDTQRSSMNNEKREDHVDSDYMSEEEEECMAEDAYHHWWGA